MTYAVFLEEDVHEDRRKLPGNVRQRVRRAISDLGADPRPAGSLALDASGLDLPAGVEVRRFRLGPWRLVYAVHDAEAWVWVLALRHRPPYDYADLQRLLKRLPPSE